jgi:hypothetical protein
MARKNLQKKNYKIHLRNDNYEVCTAVAHCFPNILDVMVLENIKMIKYGDRYDGLMKQTWMSVGYIRCQQSIYSTEH